ncbi:DUF3784 domain-containing protein [Priestia flexa]|uniref:DUF3784 domain-containing protein n=1 Tax=Priestia flexa TaxID=86664 RepID=UPI00288D3E4D|nr:DUF3784 domain-containing protein [Priestia flexa]MDT2046637.1 DUF3784 domain-containing protein [Priestia flexa]
MIPFLILAFVLSKGKGGFLIAGYNTLPTEKKAEYDEVALCKFMGKIMYASSFGILLLGLSDVLANQPLFIIGMIVFVVSIAFALIYLNTGDRFKKRST